MHIRLHSLILGIGCLFVQAGLHAAGLDDLFDEPAAETTPSADQAAQKPVPQSKSVVLKPTNTIWGSIDLGAARTVADPEHWSKLKLGTNLNAKGVFSDTFKWRLGARVAYDDAYSRNQDIYPPAVRDNQRTEFELRENYLDAALLGWDFRLGKQHIVWGEMIGTFVADVISPRDMREFLTADFDTMRRTQWAIRAERFSGDWHGELVWIPVQTYDNIGKPGAEFYPYPAPPVAGTSLAFDQEVRPRYNFDNGGFGGRVNVLTKGWDISGFTYFSRDASPTFERRIVNSPTPLTIYRPVHDRIRQFGATFSKDVAGTILKGEAVWTNGRRYTLTRLDDDDGLLSASSLDYALGADFNFAASTRLNLQFLQRYLTRYDTSMLVDRVESAGSVLVNHKWTRSWETQLLWVSSFNRHDGWVSPYVLWKAQPNLNFKFGAEYFYGPSIGYFGRYDAKDRWYGEMKYSF